MQSQRAGPMLARCQSFITSSPTAPALPPLSYGGGIQAGRAHHQPDLPGRAAGAGRHPGQRGGGRGYLPQVRTVRSIPCPFLPGAVGGSGECIMRLSTLKAYNRTAAELLKNARTGCRGPAEPDPAVTAQRKLDAFSTRWGLRQSPLETMRHDGL